MRRAFYIVVFLAFVIVATVIACGVWPEIDKLLIGLRTLRIGE